jgi:hydrogenase maturation protease
LLTYIQKMENLSGPREKTKFLLIAYGNEYRADDGIGQFILQKIGINVDKKYINELTLDLVEDIKDYENVVFIDASIEGDPVNLRKIEPENKTSPLSHHLPPERILYFVNLLYKKNPQIYLLSVRGYDFDFKNEISPRAIENAMKGIEKLKSLIMGKI